MFVHLWCLVEVLARDGLIFGAPSCVHCTCTPEFVHLRMPVKANARHIQILMLIMAIWCHPIQEHPLVMTNVKASQNWCNHSLNKSAETAKHVGLGRPCLFAPVQSNFTYITYIFGVFSSVSQAPNNAKHMLKYVDLAELPESGNCKKRVT